VIRRWQRSLGTKKPLIYVRGVLVEIQPLMDA